MATTIDRTGMQPGGDEVWAIERRGIDLIPDAERHGKPTELFWVWAATNTIITYAIFGSIIGSLGLSFGQMLVIVLVANLFFILVGIGGIPGARAGTATLTISRASFGRQGNLVTSVLSWLTAVGWEAVNLVLGAFALFSFVGVFGWQPDVAGKGFLFAILAAFTFGIAILGHATIVYLQRIFTIALGIVILGLVPMVISHADLAKPLAAAPEGASFASLAIAFMLVASGPISYVNCPADYTRYLPRNASGGAILFWTFVGSYVPAVIITIIGYLAATAVDLTDPIGGFAGLVPAWYFDIFVLVVAGGSVTNNFINTYSSGMSLLAAGINVKRQNAILIDAVLATIASVYAIFIYDFTPTFIAFLSLMIAWLAPWCGVYLMDAWLRGSRYRDADLVSPEGGVYRGWNAPGFISWGAGVIAALLCTNATIFQSPVAESLLGGGDFSIVAGLVVSAVLYAIIGGPKVRRQ